MVLKPVKTNMNDMLRMAMLKFLIVLFSMMKPGKFMFMNGSKLRTALWPLLIRTFVLWLF